MRERADPCVDDGMRVYFLRMRVYASLRVYVCTCVCVCAEIFAVIYYTCTCQSIGTEEELKRKEMKL